MDSPTQFTHVSLCAGYGGIDLGLRRAIPNLRTVAFSEIEAFACANLVAKMEAGQLDPAPVWTDLKTFPWAAFRDRVDILSGGYPCQPFSAAGKRLGADDPRHLWPFIAAGIAEMRPSLCFFENVEGHITLGLPDVIEQLAGLGYRTTWGLFSAAEVGATHQRKRVFIMAHRIDEGLQGRLRRWADTRWQGVNGHPGCSGAGSRALWPARPGQAQHSWEPPRVIGAVPEKLADFCLRNPQPRRNTTQTGGEGIGAWRQSEDAMPYGRPSICRGDKRDEPPRVVDDGNGLDGSTSAGGREHDAKAGSAGAGEAEPTLGRNAHGPAGGLGHAQLFTTSDNRTDELRLLGNGVVPATAERAFITLLNELLHKGQQI